MLKMIQTRMMLVVMVLIVLNISFLGFFVLYNCYNCSYKNMHSADWYYAVKQIIIFYYLVSSFLIYIGVFKIIGIKKCDSSTINTVTFVFFNNMGFTIFQIFSFPIIQHSYFLKQLQLYITILGIFISAVLTGKLVIAFMRFYFKIIKKNSSYKTLNCRRQPQSLKNADDLKQRLRILMEEEKLYRDHNLDITMLAERLNISRMHASRLLNEHFGMNFYEFINRCRIEEIISALKIPGHDHSVIDLAFQAGFNSVSTFYKYFKKETGESPLDFRDKQLVKICKSSGDDTMTDKFLIKK